MSCGLENTRDSLISPVNGDRKVVIQRIHDTADLAKFACQISPAVLPGESAVVGYICLVRDPDGNNVEFSVEQDLG